MRETMRCALENIGVARRGPCSVCKKFDRRTSCNDIQRATWRCASCGVIVHADTCYDVHRFQQNDFMTRKDDPDTPSLRAHAEIHRSFVCLEVFGRRKFHRCSFRDFLGFLRRNAFFQLQVTLSKPTGASHP